MSCYIVLLSNCITSLPILLLRLVLRPRKATNKDISGFVV